MKNTKRTRKLKYNIMYRLLPLLMAAFVLTGCVNPQAAASSVAASAESQTGGQEAGLASSSEAPSSEAEGEITFEKPTDLLEVIPEYSGEPYAVVNGNAPFFKEEDLTTEAFETYSELDDLGRCGVAYANICEEIQPTEKRGSISAVKPTGWVQKKYDFVDGKSLYNRCHLIGFQLAGENANKLNLITGTRYFNVDGMLPFEDKVDYYIEDKPKNHVLYRVTPIFEGNNLVAAGVLMEARSVEDDGVVFCVFCCNVQPGVTIDYKTGDSYEASKDEKEALPEAA